MELSQYLEEIVYFKNEYSRKKEKLKINYLNFQLKKLESNQQIKLKGGLQKYEQKSKKWKKIYSI
jgi:hypothetical protein